MNDAVTLLGLLDDEAILLDEAALRNPSHDDGCRIEAGIGHALERHRKSCLSVDDRDEGFGRILARHRPKARPRAAAQDHGHDHRMAFLAHRHWRSGTRIRIVPVSPK